jgi:hypothetical protein
MAKNHTNDFWGTSENGEHYHIIEYTEMLDSATYGHPQNRMSGLKEYSLEGGLLVNRITDSEFEIVSTGLRIHVPTDPGTQN